MGQACSRPAARASGGHPDLAPLSWWSCAPELSSAGGKVATRTDHLVGRAEELSSLDPVLAEVARGASAATLLLGETGIGKTRLLAEIAGHADGRGHLVLSGAASELERDLPFSVFVD